MANQSAHRRRPFAACLLATLATLATLAAASCKETARTKESGDAPEIVTARKTAKPAAATGGLFAADPLYMQKNADFYFKVWNSTFTAKLDELPQAGEVPDGKKPYSGSYYAESDGGTDLVVAGSQSPLQKYDQAFNGGQPKAQQWEHDKHTGGPEWSGHCNGFSAASSRHAKEPSKSVVRGGVTFAPQDIKALLAEVYMSADYEFLGGNRCDSTTIKGPGDRPNKTVRDDCEGINPGTLHVAVANWIGRQAHNVIVDAYPAGEIWNYPLYKYQVLSQTTVTAQQASQAVDGSSTYAFNPNAVKFVQVSMRLTYAEATRKEVLGQLYPKDMDLQYILEVDGNGAVVGGEWLKGTQKFFPGFLWVALPPLQPNGTAFMGNQFVDANTVIGMWAESIGADPAHPPADITRPPDSSTWGRWAGFSLVLDGSQSGAVFAGKPPLLHVTRTAGGPLDGAGFAVDVQLNGTSVKTYTTTASEPLAVSLDAAGIGLNKLELIWKSNGTVAADETVDFHMMR